MTKSELINRIADSHSQLSRVDIDLAVKILLEQVSEALVSGERIEVRGFGSFTLHRRAARRGRNPKSGEMVDLAEKGIPHFKPGKELRERVNSTLNS